MKLTIRISQSAFIRSIIRSILIINICCSYGFIKEHVLLQEDGAVSISTSDLRLYTPANRLFQFNDSINYFMVIKNNRNCLDCFRSMNDCVKKIKTVRPACYVVISATDSTTLDRKRNYITGKNLMPDFNEYLFQYDDSKNAFAKLNIEYTPEILIISHGVIHRFSNREIFDYASTNVSAITYQKILDLLK